MKTWIKRLLMLMLLLTAILMLAAPGALADYAKDFSDFDETDWENFHSGSMYICPGCEDWYSEGDGCEECYLCWDCCADSTDHCPNDAMHGWDEDTWCESCGCAASAILRANCAPPAAIMAKSSAAPAVQAKAPSSAAATASARTMRRHGLPTGAGNAACA